MLTRSAYALLPQVEKLPMRIYAYAGIGIAAGLIGAFIATENAPNQTGCEYGIQASGAVHDVVGTDHLVRKAPDPDAERLVNQKSSTVFKETHYHTIDKSTRVKVSCLTNSWAKITIARPTWLTNVSGWVERSAIGAEHPLGVPRPIMSTDIPWEGEALEYKDKIVAALNRLQDTESFCKDFIHFYSLTKSDQSRPGHPPKFLVFCGEDESNSKAFHFYIGP